MSKKLVLITVIVFVIGAFTGGVIRGFLLPSTAPRTSEAGATVVINKTVTTTVTRTIVITHLQHPYTVTATFTFPATETLMRTLTVAKTLTVRRTETVGEVSTICFSRLEECDDIITSLIDGANRSIHVMMYVFTSDPIREALIRARRRGVEVRVVVEEKEAYIRGSEVERLREAGVEVALDSNPYLMHHKVMIVDGKIVVTGSYNWSWSAEHRNDENLIVLVSPRVAGEYEAEFQRVWGEAAKLG